MITAHGLPQALCPVPLAEAALALLARQFDGEEDGILTHLRRTDPKLRQRLARQWRAWPAAGLSQSYGDRREINIEIRYVDARLVCECGHAVVCDT